MQNKTWLLYNTSSFIKQFCFYTLTNEESISVSPGNTEEGYCYALWLGHLGHSSCYILLLYINCYYIRPLKTNTKSSIHKNCF